MMSVMTPLGVQSPGGRTHARAPPPGRVRRPGGAARPPRPLRRRVRRPGGEMAGSAGGAMGAQPVAPAGTAPRRVLRPRGRALLAERPALVRGRCRGGCPGAAPPGRPRGDMPIDEHAIEERVRTAFRALVCEEEPLPVADAQLVLQQVLRARHGRDDSCSALAPHCLCFRAAACAGA